VGTEQHVIEIDTDRDCILYILKHHLGISFQGALVREKTVDRRQVFLSAVLRLGAKLAKADGRVSREEIRAFKEVFKIDEATVPDAAHIFEQAAGSQQGIEEIAGEVFSLVGDNRKRCSNTSFWGSCRSRPPTACSMKPSRD
jgi:hypothetical protein